MPASAGDHRTAGTSWSLGSTSNRLRCDDVRLNKLRVTSRSASDIHEIASTTAHSGAADMPLRLSGCGAERSIKAKRRVIKVTIPPLTYDGGVVVGQRCWGAARSCSFPLQISDREDCGCSKFHSRLPRNFSEMENFQPLYLEKIFRQEEIFLPAEIYEREHFWQAKIREKLSLFPCHDATGYCSCCPLRLQS